MADQVTSATEAVANEFGDVFNTHDLDAIMALMTDDVVFESTAPPGGERFEGADAVRGAWKALFEASPTARFDAEDVIAGGDRCVVRWVYTWDGDDCPPDGLHGVDVLRIRDGKVAEKLAYVKG